MLLGPAGARSLPRPSLCRSTSRRRSRSPRRSPPRDRRSRPARGFPRAPPERASSEGAAGRQTPRSAGIERDAPGLPLPDGAVRAAGIRASGPERASCETDAAEGPQATHEAPRPGARPRIRRCGRCSGASASRTKGDRETRTSRPRYSTTSESGSPLTRLRRRLVRRKTFDARTTRTGRLRRPISPHPAARNPRFMSSSGDARARARAPRTRTDRRREPAWTVRQPIESMKSVRSPFVPG